MSQQISTDIPAAPRKRIRKVWSCCLAIVLGTPALAFALMVGLTLAIPLRYESKASIQIRAVQPMLLGISQRPQEDYDSFVNTQIAYLRSPAVLDRALEVTEVARLPIVIQQKDKRAWLARNLRIQSEGQSEIVTISIKTNAEEASEKIVNAVVYSYFNFVEEIHRATDTTLLTQLQVEKRRQTQQVQQLQDNIRRKTGFVAGRESHIVPDSGELLLQEMAIAEVALVKLRAERKAIVERMKTLEREPPTILVQFEPEVVALNAQKDALWKQRKDMSMDDPKGLDILHQIKELEDKISEIATQADDGTMKPLRDHLLAAEKMELCAVEQEVQAQEIMIDELRNAYIDRLTDMAARAENVVNITFDMTQLERTNKTIDAIDNRILAIQSEARAPGRITQLTKAVNTAPSRLWWLGCW